jgi:DNA replication protein DnaC
MDHLRELKLFGMLRAFESQSEMKNIEELSFEDRLGLLVDAELLVRQNKRLDSRLRNARLRLSACIEDVEAKANRGLDKTVLATLATCDWLRRHRNVLITGFTGTGKTYLSCALAQKACREGFSVVFKRSSALFEELALAKADGRYGKLLLGISRMDLLVIDDFALAPLTAEQSRDLLEIVEDRYDRRSTIISSQVPLDHWHGIIGEPTIADAILDRLVHNAHKIKLKGESKRKEKFPDGDIS